MNAQAILERLRASGLYLKVEGDKLRVGPREAITPETLELVKAHKAALIQAIERPLETALGSVRSWRWRCHYGDGTYLDRQTLPEATEAEMRVLWSDAAWFEPLPETIQ